MPSWREKYGWHRGSGGEHIFQNMRKTPTGSYRCVRRAGPRRADSETSLRSVSSCHGSRRDTDNKKKGMALSKLSHAFLFVVVVAARC